MKGLYVALFLVASINYLDFSGATLTLHPTGRIETCPNNLTVYCDLTDYKKIPDAAALVSLVISRKDNVTQAQVDLVSINAFSGQITSHPNINGTTEGKLDADGLSFLRLSYQTPSSEAVTDYMCEAHAITMFGRPVKISAYAKVAEMKAGGGTPAEIINGIPSNEALNLMADYLFLRQKEDNINITGNWYAESGLLNNHKYLLSKHALDIDVAWAKCSQEGGYLVELNSKDEYDFVKSFLMNENLNFAYYVTGALYQNSTFSFLRNQNDNVYLDVKGNEPGLTGNPKCLGLNKAMSYQMYGVSCSDQHKSFICEIPVNPATKK